MITTNSIPPRGKLGKQPAVHVPGALRLAAYLPPEKIPLPKVIDNYSCVKDWGMMHNDVLGDCTCAAVGHATQAWTAMNKKEVIIPDDEIVRAYSAITGYTPNDPNTDQGAVEADVLKYWMETGFAGHKLDNYAVVETTSTYQMKLALFLFGDVYTGIDLPLSAQNQHIWSVSHGGANQPGSWGGHAVPIVGADYHHATCITWGQPLKMTWGFWHKYGDEAYAPLGMDWVDQQSKLAPNHLLWDDLKTDLEHHFKHR